MNVPGFVGPAYTSISLAINAQRTINLRLEIDAANGKVPLALVGLPGYAALKEDFPEAPVRGYWQAQGRTFVVVGTKLYELINSSLAHIELASLDSFTGLVSFADNGLHMLLVDGVGVRALELATNTVTDTITDFPYGATFLAAIDNTLIANEPGSQRFHISLVGQALVWRPIDFTSAEGSPDDLVAMVPFNRQLYTLGTKSLQVFWNSGNADRPFVPLEGSFIEVGCVAPNSALKDESGVYWLGGDSRGGPRVYKSVGGQTNVISTPALDILLKTYTVADAEAFTFRMDGHIFYVLTFPTDDQTWVYDAKAEAWYEFLEWDSGWSRHRGHSTIYAFGKQLLGDFENGKIYELSSAIYANDGRPLRALRASAHVCDDEKIIPVGSFEVVCEPGVGLTTGQGSDPQLMLRVSKDGGHNWTSEMWRTVGRKGDYRGRARWARPCGLARDLVFEVSMTDPVKRTWVKALINQV